MPMAGPINSVQHYPLGPHQAHGPVPGAGAGCQGRTFLDPVLKPVERLIYRLAGIDPAKEQDWKGYAVSVLIFSLVTLLLTYLILRLQGVLPLNPQGFSGVAGDLPLIPRPASPPTPTGRTTAVKASCPICPRWWPWPSQFLRPPWA